MKPLLQQHCSPCHQSADLVDTIQATALLKELPQWAIVEISKAAKKESDITLKSLQKITTLQATFAVSRYEKGIEFVNAIAKLAQTVDHHPRIVIDYSSVTVSWWTITLNGLHQNDFILAAKTSALHAQYC